MGVPEFMVREIIRAHNVQVFSSNYALYGDMSQRVMETLRNGRRPLTDAPLPLPPAGMNSRLPPSRFPP